MSDSEGTPTPAPAPAPVPAPAATKEDPTWLPERLERERRSMLRDLGVENVADVKAALADLKAKRESEKSDAVKAAEALTRATAVEASNSVLRATVAEYAGRQMIGLTPEQKAAVTAIAGEDPAMQLKTIAALQPTWAAAAPPPAAPPPVSKDTTPAPNAPPSVSPNETNHSAYYKALKTTNPFKAAEYAAKHSTAIFGQ